MNLTHHSNGNIPLANRWNSIGTSIFSEMTRLSNKAKAVNLGQGAPNFNGPQKLLDAICKQVQTCHNQYSASAGEYPLRVELSKFIEKKTGALYNPHEEITVTCGASEAIFCTLNAYLSVGDKVLLFEPAFDLYAQAIANTGAQIVPIPLIPPSFQTTTDGLDDTWKIDWKAFEDAQKQDYKCIIINTPHNPTGKIFTKEEILRIGEAALLKNALLIADEVYENLSFEESKPYISVASFPEFRDITIRISSAAKLFGFTGMKVGWASGPKHLMHGLQLVHQSTVFSINPALQLGLADCLADSEWLDEYLTNQKKEYLHKRNLLSAILKEAGFLISACEGTFFISGNYKKLSDERDSVVFAKQLIEDKKIGTIPLSPFLSKPQKDFKWIRFAFCKTEESLIQAEKNLKLRS